MANAYWAVTVALLVSIVICMCCVLAVYAVYKNFSQYLMSLLTMLAVGTLIGDAFLHLIPKSYGVHEDVKNNNGTLDARHDEHTVIYKSMAIVASVYGLFVINWLILLLKCGHGHSHNNKSGSQDDVLNVEKDTPQKVYTEKDVDSFMDQEKEDMVLQINRAHAAPEDVNTSSKNMEKEHTSLPHLIYVIVISSFLHNISDGLAIGVAFSDCLSGGISTTIAVLCHEIPHVIGHFIIIHIAGLTVRTSLFVVMVTYLANFIGAYTGVAIGTHFKASDWIFAVTAGMFLYVSLVQLLPEMLRRIQEGQTWTFFILQNIGFLLGFSIMTLIAFYEDLITIHIS